MKTIRKTLITAIVSIAICAPFFGNAQTIVPKPTSMTLAEGEFKLTQTTMVYTNLRGKERKELLEYINSTAPFALKTTNKLASQNIIKLICTAKKPAENVHDDTELQAYDLRVSPTEIEIKAPSAAGLFYGWQSVRHLTDTLNSVKSCTIQDAPRFAYRGLMIDCSRHFWTIDHLKKQIDAMAYLKMSRLHLHLTDAGGWRMEIKRYPLLTEKTAYRTHSDWTEWWDGKIRTYATKHDTGAYGGYYTQKELRELVDYAQKRHIIVIPEIEMPGHSDEAIVAYPWLSCQDKAYSSGDMCVGKESTYEFLENVLKEVMAVFPSEYIHIGGDEAGRKEWETCAHCKQKMAEENLTTTAELQSYMTHRIEKFLNKNGRQLLGWDEIMEGNLAPNASVMSWRGEEAGIKAAQAGHKVIMTPGAYCYIDAYQDAPPSQPLAFGSYLPLDKVYSYEPVPTHLKGTATEKLFYGVQTNMWTELVETPEHLEYMIYPRTIAIAEVGWSKAKTPYHDFRKRTLKVLDYMKSRGYNTFDLRNEHGHRGAGAGDYKQHDAIGKTVHYTTAYHNNYQGTGAKGLVDGLRGDWNFNDGQWQGFIGDGRFEAVVDMEQSISIKDIIVELLQFRGPDIHFPSEISFEISDDGINFTPLHTEQYPYDTTPYFIKQCTWSGSAHGRYIRCKAKASEKGGWLFISEIVINDRLEIPIGAIGTFSE